LLRGGRPNGKSRHSVALGFWRGWSPETLSRNSVRDSAGAEIPFRISIARSCRIAEGRMRFAPAPFRRMNGVGATVYRQVPSPLWVGRRFLLPEPLRNRSFHAPDFLAPPISAPLVALQANSASVRSIDRVSQTLPETKTFVLFRRTIHAPKSAISGKVGNRCSRWFSTAIILRNRARVIPPRPDFPDSRKKYGDRLSYLLTQNMICGIF
jgi:hypothetical protein